MDAERNEISIQEVRVYRVLQRGDWLTSKQIAASSGVAARTARLHAKKLTDLGILDCAEVFPGHRYRLSAMAQKRNGSYVQRLDRASDVFGEMAKT